MKYLFSVLLFWGSVAMADEVVNCSRIDDQAERLACFDRLFPSDKSDTSEVDAPPESTALPEISNDQIEAVAELPAEADAQPALPEPPADIPSAAEPADPADESTAKERFGLGSLFSAPEVNLTTSIVTIRRGDKQKMVFALANEQIWIQSTPRMLPFKEGDAVTIENATLGGYFMRSKHGTSTRVQRIK